MCALTFSVSAAAFAQHERVTLNFRQATVRQVLNEIQRQTRLSFIYNTEQTEQLGQISVEAHNESVTSLFNKLVTLSLWASTEICPICSVCSVL